MTHALPPVSEALKRSVERDRRLYGPVDWADVPKTRPVSKWTGFKPVAATIRNFRIVQSAAPSPTLPRRSSKLDRSERARFARGVEDVRRQTRTKGESGRTNQGAISALGVEIVKALAFDFYNVATGRLDPAHETIAAKVGCHASTVRRQLKAAKRLGLLDWVRRAAHFVAGAWKRRSNSYQLALGTTVKIQDSNGLRVAASHLSLSLRLRDEASRVNCNLLT